MLLPKGSEHSGPTTRTLRGRTRERKEGQALHTWRGGVCTKLPHSNRELLPRTMARLLTFAVGPQHSVS